MRERGNEGEKRNVGVGPSQCLKQADRIGWNSRVVLVGWLAHG